MAAHSVVIQYVVITKAFIKIFYIVFTEEVLETLCAFYTYSRSQFWPVTFQVLNSFMWLVFAVLYSATVTGVHCSNISQFIYMFDHW